MRTIQPFLRILCVFVTIALLTGFAPIPTTSHSSTLRFKSGGHILGFASQGMYASQSGHTLRVDFAGANTVQPQAAAFIRQSQANAYSHTNAHANRNTHPDAYSYSDNNIHQNWNAYPNFYANTNINTYPDVNADSDSYGDSYTYPHPSCIHLYIQRGRRWLDSRIG